MLNNTFPNASDDSGSVNPYKIRLTQWNGNYAGYYDWHRGVLHLYYRGIHKPYPIERLQNQFRGDASEAGTVTMGGDGNAD